MGTGVTTRIEQCSCELKQAVTHPPRKMSENIFYWKFSKWRTSNFWKKNLKTKTKFFSLNSIWIMWNLIWRYPPQMQNRYEDPLTTRYTVRKKEKNFESIFTENKNISTKCRRNEIWEFLAVQNEHKSLIVCGINAKIVSVMHIKKI